MAVDANRERLIRVTRALQAAGIPHAVVGGLAVASWVASREPDAVRTTKDVDMLLRRRDLPEVRAVLEAIGLVYEEVRGIGMFLDQVDPSPRRAVHLVWAEEKVHPYSRYPAPPVEHHTVDSEGHPIINLIDLVQMKLVADRHHDRAHLCDMIDVGLIDRQTLRQLPEDLAARLEPLLDEMNRSSEEC